jgi:hypothetical protein
MAIITAATTRGSVKVTGNSGVYASWQDIRDFTNGTSVSVNTNDTTAIRVSDTTTKLTTTWNCNRYFIAFDTTSITSTPGSATLYVYGLSTANNDIIVVKVTQASSFGTGSNVATTNFSNIQGYVYAQDWTGFVTDYSGVYAALLGWQAIPLNSTALSDMNTYTNFKLAIVDYNDYTYAGPLGGQILNLGLNSLTNAPYIEYTSFNGKVNSIALASVNNVDGVSIGSISKINT